MYDEADANPRRSASSNLHARGPTVPEIASLEARTGLRAGVLDRRNARGTRGAASRTRTGCGCDVWAVHVAAAPDLEPAEGHPDAQHASLPRAHTAVDGRDGAERGRVPHARVWALGRCAGCRPAGDPHRRRLRRPGPVRRGPPESFARP